MKIKYIKDSLKNLEEKYDIKSSNIAIQIKQQWDTCDLSIYLYN